MSQLLNGLEIARTALAGLLLLVALLVLLLLTVRARRGRRPYVRPLPAFDRVPSELGAAAEAGAALHLGLGSGGIGGDKSLTSLAGLQVLEGFADAAIAYGTPPVVTVGDPTLLPLAQDVLRRAYSRAGIPRRYDPNAVRFIAPDPTVYALGAGDVVGHERVEGNVLAGLFGEEAVLLTCAGERRGLAQMAAADRLRALGALYPADTLLAAGEELYAAGARLSGLAHYLASLSTQDLLRFLLVLVVLMAVLGIV